MNKDFIQIIQAALLGDKMAYEALYTMTKDSTYFVALSITHNEQDALDILQDSYIKAFSALDTVKEPEHFDSWINRIVSNNSKNYLKRKKPVLFSDIYESTVLDNLHEETDGDFVPHELVDKKETSRLLMEIINGLAEDKRLIILMYYYQDMSTTEIADMLELPLTTVKYKLLAARGDIKKELEKLDKEGTRLYAALPFAIFPSMLSHAAKNISAPAYSSISGAVSGALTSSAGSIFTKNGGTGMLLKTTASKIIAAIVTVVVVGGGITAAVIIGNNNKDSVQTPSSVSDNVYEDNSQYPSSSENEDNATTVETAEGDFEYTVYDDYVTIDKYIGEAAGVKIPEKIEGKPVTVINAYCFIYNSTLTSIIIPNTVTTIGENAISYCSSLTDIVIPNSVTTIEKEAFKACDSLESVTISGSVTSIGDNAFYSCASLKSVTMERLDGDIDLGYCAFGSCKELRDVTLPDNIKIIGDRMFQNCYELAEIDIPNSVEIIGDGAFRNCTALKSVTVPGSVETVRSGAFSGCKELTTVVISDGVKTLEDSVFFECSALENITLSDSITSLGYQLFMRCDKLETVTLPKNITAIEEYMFFHCDALKSITIPEGVISIASYAFKNCVSLENIYIPESVENIGHSTIDNCTSLTAVHGKTGSVAEKYAEYLDIEFIPE